MKSFEYIHGIFAGYIQMFFMSFSQCYFSGFSLVCYHEKFINKVMKPPHTMNNRAKTMVKVWCWFLMFLFYDDENPMNQTAQVQGEFRRFPWHYKTLRVMKNVWFPPELGIINGLWKCSKQFYGFFIALLWPVKIYADTLKVVSSGEEGSMRTLDEDL